uniref:Uncharacterized protein n=1 Tax=Sphingobacterium sp. (strain 21) TaxID=743722 RepID=F4CES3_SPHS2
MIINQKTDQQFGKGPIFGVLFTKLLNITKFI